MHYFTWRLLINADKSYINCWGIFLGYNLSYTYGTRLRYMAITINTTMNGRNLGYPTGLPIREAWESFVTERVGVYYFFYASLTINNFFTQALGTWKLMILYIVNTQLI